MYMQYKVKVFQILPGQSAYGPYLATVIWVSGCRIRCKGCFNPHLFDGSLGSKMSPFKILDNVLKGKKRGDTAVVIVGGEPMDQAFPLFLTILLLRLVWPKMTITVYTGDTYPTLLKKQVNRLVLGLINYLVDGPFIESQADDNLGYRGSSNQRVIDLKSTRKFGQVMTRNWDHLILIDDNAISTTPSLSANLGLTGEAIPCGSTKEQR
jgi:anaerobic ribonucleoside-triphosphate reductase activating protein